MTERLDRIERIIEATARTAEANANAIAAGADEMHELRALTASASRTAEANANAIAAGADEMHELRALTVSTARTAEANANAIAAGADEMHELRALTVSTARTAEANANAIAEMKQSLEASIPDLVQMIQNLAQSFEASRVEAAADRAEMRRMIEAIYGDRINGNGDS